MHDNNATTADTKDLEYPTFGNGIILAGGRDNLVTGNLVERQEGYGIAVMPNLDANLWVSSGNVVRDNVVRDSGRADLALGAPAAGGDCFSGNTISSSLPPAIQLLRGCGSFGAKIGGGDLAPTLNLGTRFLDALDGAFPHGDWRTQPAPPDQPGMVNPAKAPPQPAIPDQAVPQQYRIRPVSEIPSSPGATREEGSDRVRDPAAGHVVVEPADRPLRVRAARIPLRGVAHDRAVGSDPAGVGADLVPGSVDAGRDPGAVPGTDPLLRVRPLARSRGSCG